MSIEGLRRFNAGYGFPFHKESRTIKNDHNITQKNGKVVTTLAKIMVSIPFLAIILANKDNKPANKIFKYEPGFRSRFIMASTIVGLPIVCALDIIATLITQPIGRVLEKRRAQQLQ